MTGTAPTLTPDEQQRSSTLRTQAAVIRANERIEWLEKRVGRLEAVIDDLRRMTRREAEKSSDSEMPKIPSDGRLPSSPSAW